MERVAAELIASGISASTGGSSGPCRVLFYSVTTNCQGELEPKATLEDKAMRMTEIIAVAAGGAGLAAYYKARISNYCQSKTTK